MSCLLMLILIINYDLPESEKQGRLILKDGIVCLTKSSDKDGCTHKIYVPIFFAKEVRTAKLLKYN